MKNYLLDACALIAYLTDETGAAVVEHRLTQARRDAATVSIHWINLLEVYYGFYRDAGKDAATKMLHDVINAAIAIIGDDRDNPAFLEAGRLKASYKMSLADAIFLASARVNNFIALTSDHHEFDAVETRETGIQFEWIR